MAAKLSEEDVSEIVAYIISGTRQTKIAKKYAITSAEVGHIKTGRAWSHLISVEQYRLMKECGTHRGNPAICTIHHKNWRNVA